MKCKDCEYCDKNEIYDICKITNIILNCSLGEKIIGCELESDKDVKSMDICFNCKHWIGCGDWGLSCKKDYYNCSTNGFDKICKWFEREV